MLLSVSSHFNLQHQYLKEGGAAGLDFGHGDNRFATPNKNDEMNIALVGGVPSYMTDNFMTPIKVPASNLGKLAGLTG